MCDPSGIANDHGIVHAGRRAADAVLERYLGLPVQKALDLGTPRGLDRAIAGLAAQLRARASAPDHAAVRAAIEVLDVDWHQTTAEQRRTLIARALEVAGRRTTALPRQLRAVFDPAADAVVRATRDGARRRQRLGIGVDFNAIDHRIVRHLQTSQASYVTDEYGRRHEAFSAQARSIVEDGLTAGLGRDDIARDLGQAAKDVIAGRSSFYWDIIAATFVSRGRSFAQLSAYAEAGITRYVIEAILDEATTSCCRFMHGKTFSVASGLRTFEQVEAHPDRIKALTPWVREARDPQSGRAALFVERDGVREPVALVTRSGVGTRDDLGEFSRGRGEQELAGLGLVMPPFHGACRSTLLADVT